MGRKPLGWARLLTAYGSAAVVAALLAGLVSLSPYLMVVVMGVVLAFELVVLLPIYVALHYRDMVNRGTVLTIGFLVGALPIAWFTWPLRYPEVRHIGAVPGSETHEFEVTCDSGRHAFIVGTTVEHQDRIVFTTRKVAELPKAEPEAATIGSDPGK